MALFRLVCKNCGAERPSKKSKLVCKNCGAEMVRNPKVTSQVVETIDNGFMPKRIERPKDIGETMKERSNKYKAGRDPYGE